MAKDENVNVAKADPFVGKVFDKYMLIERLGAGGMGTVYRAEQKHIKRQVAVKLLSMRLLNDEKNVKRIEREATAMGNLRHPNIATMFDFGFSEDGQPYLVMELIKGRSLKDLLRENKYLSPQRAMNIVSQIADAMSYAHKNGIIHRDLKPDNVMLDIEHKEDFVKVLDFGIAKTTQVDESLNLTQTGDVVGSPLYMSPEQCTGQKLDLRSDIYALGIILYESMTGIVPGQGATLFETIGRKTTEEPPPFPGHIAHLKDLEHLTLAMLARWPEDRPPSMMAVKDALDSIYTQYFGPIAGNRSGSYSQTGGQPYSHTGSRPGDSTGNRHMAAGERTADGGSLSQYENRNRDGGETAEGPAVTGRDYDGRQTGSRTRDRGGYGTQDRSRSRTGGGGTYQEHDGREDLSQSGTITITKNKQIVLIGVLIVGLWLVVGAVVVFFCFTLSGNKDVAKQDNGTTKPPDVVKQPINLDKPTGDSNNNNNNNNSNKNNNTIGDNTKKPVDNNSIVKKPAPPPPKPKKEKPPKVAKVKNQTYSSRNTYQAPASNYTYVPPRETYVPPPRNAYVPPEAPPQYTPPARTRYSYSSPDLPPQRVDRRQSFSDGSEFGNIYQNQRQSAANYANAERMLRQSGRAEGYHVNRRDPYRSRNSYDSNSTQYGY